MQIFIQGDNSASTSQDRGVRPCKALLQAIYSYRRDDSYRGGQRVTGRKGGRELEKRRKEWVEGRSADSLRKTETRRDEDRQAAKRQRGGVVKVER